MRERVCAHVCGVRVCMCAVCARGVCAVCVWGGLGKAQ